MFTRSAAHGTIAADNFISTNIKIIMPGQGNIRFNLHRLKIIGSPECPRKHGTQTADHLIFQCKRLKGEREILKNIVLKVGNWPVSKSELTNRNIKQLNRYITSKGLEKISHSNEQM